MTQRLSKQQRDALTKARHAPLRRIHTPGPGKPPWPAHASTLRSLERRDLLERDDLRNRHGYLVDTWTITDAGHLALNPPPRNKTETPLFLAHTTTATGQLQPPYTSDPGRAMRDENGAIGAVPPAELTFLASPRAIARHARELASYAERAGLSDELDQLRHALAAIDRHRRAGHQAA